MKASHFCPDTALILVTWPSLLTLAPENEMLFLFLPFLGEMEKSVIPWLGKKSVLTEVVLPGLALEAPGT